jgi:hypothetical protein
VGTTEWLHKLWPLERYSAPQISLYIVSDIRRTEIHTAQQPVTGTCGRDVETAITKLKKYKSPGSDQIPADLIQAGGDT